MRLALCTLSAVLLSGCSWLGIGGSSSSSYGAGSAYGCAPGTYGGGQYAYGNQGSYMGQGGAGCAGAGGYGVAGNGYGAGSGAYGAGGYGAGAGAYGAGGYGAGSGAYGAGGYGAGSGAYGAGGYGAGAGAYGAGGYGPGSGAYGAGAGAYGAGAGLGLNGLRGAQGATGYGLNGYGVGGGAGYGAGTGTVLGAGTQFGSAVGGQYVNGQWVSGGTAGGTSTYQTVQGAPIYVPQPYPAYYGVASGGGFGLRGAGAALPFGLEAGIGTDFNIDGDIFPGEAAKPALPGPGTVSELSPVSYKDAYSEAVHYDLAATYDVDPSTTLIGRIGYSRADGNRLSVGSVDDGAGLSEELFAEFSDLEQVTLEGGVRKYMGGWNNRFAGVRPYVGATAGFTHNNSVDVVQSSATLVDPALFTQEYIDAGWTPTASGVVGAEMQVGPRTAIGVETGIRWSDDLNTNFESDDRLSIPVRLRGRVSF